MFALWRVTVAPDILDMLVASHASHSVCRHNKFCDKQYSRVLCLVAADGIDRIVGGHNTSQTSPL